MHKMKHCFGVVGTGTFEEGDKLVTAFRNNKCKLNDQCLENKAILPIISLPLVPFCRLKNKNQGGWKNYPLSSEWIPCFVRYCGHGSLSSREGDRAERAGTVEPAVCQPPS